MEQIKIIKHEKTEPLNDRGHVLYPFSKWETSSIGDGWNTKFDESILNKNFVPLHFINKNPWTALKLIKVHCFDYEEKVRYVCPYTKYAHYWCLPLFIFCEDMNVWIERINEIDKNVQKKLSDTDQMRKDFFPITNKGLKFDKIQRTLLGTGITKEIEENGGNTYLYDTILRLENNDVLGSKIWMWFKK